MFPADITALIVLFVAVISFVASDIAKYAPGEKRELELRRKIVTHSRSHYHKSSRKAR
jgi:hypothetical protein